MKQLLISLSITIFISFSAFSQIEIDSSGKVGVGTNTPTTKLHVAGVITAPGGNSTIWNNKQDTLTAGTGINITNNIIRTTGCGLKIGDTIEGGMIFLFGCYKVPWLSSCTN